MIHGWVIPYRESFIQLRMTLGEAIEILDELKRLNVTPYPRMVEIEEKLVDLIERAKKLEED